MNALDEVGGGGVGRKSLSLPSLRRGAHAPSSMGGYNPKLLRRIVQPGRVLNFLETTRREMSAAPMAVAGRKTEGSAFFCVATALGY